jgi:hypothetical protein
MTPNQVSEMLRRIASAIENSKRPNPDFVVADLKTVIANIETTGQQQQQGQQDDQQQGQQGQQQQQALPKSGPGKSMLRRLSSRAMTPDSRVSSRSSRRTLFSADGGIRTLTLYSARS